jgi:hypothetical protein
LADNARKAAHGREAYHANIEEGRRKGAERMRRKSGLARLANPERLAASLARIRSGIGRGSIAGAKPARRSVAHRFRSTRSAGN